MVAGNPLDRPADYSAALCAAVVPLSVAGAAVFLAARLTAGRAAFLAAGRAAPEVCGIAAALAEGFAATLTAGLAVVFAADLAVAPWPFNF